MSDPATEWLHAMLDLDDEQPYTGMPDEDDGDFTHDDLVGGAQQALGFETGEREERRPFRILNPNAARLLRS